jgi:prepilin-type N-terminal cleavage/methylation domain-containing protein
MVNRANKNTFSNKGFTLVELSIVLVIVGLLLGLGMSMVGPLMTATKLRETRDNLDANIQAVASWASANNRIPTTAVFATVAKTPNDSWGQLFAYYYDATNLAPGTATKDTICGRRSTLISLTDLNTGANIPNVAFVILSKGDDAKLDTTFAPATTGPVSAATTISANTVNDVVRWVTLDELRSKVGCQGAPLKIVNNELPYGYNNTTYSATIYADGGVPFPTGGNNSWCIQTSLGDVATPTTITFKSNSGTDIPFKASCTAAVAVQSNSLVIGGTPIIPLVNGTDSKVYSCSQGHVAAAINQPILGANYTQYWQLAAPGATGVNWAATTAYFPSSSNSITIYAYDSVGNNSYKPFVLTINPN